MKYVESTQHLGGIQLVFEKDGSLISTEFEKTLLNQASTEKTITVPTSTEIRYISMKVSTGWQYAGIRFYDVNQNLLVDELFGTNLGTWMEVQMIPID